MDDLVQVAEAIEDGVELMGYIAWGRSRFRFLASTAELSKDMVSYMLIEMMMEQEL